MCHLRGNFDQKAIELVLSTLQAACLLLFNDTSELSYPEIQVGTRGGGGSSATRRYRWMQFFFADFPRAKLKKLWGGGWSHYWWGVGVDVRVVGCGDACGYKGRRSTLGVRGGCGVEISGEGRGGGKSLQAGCTEYLHGVAAVSPPPLTPVCFEFICLLWSEVCSARVICLILPYCC